MIPKEKVYVKKGERGTPYTLDEAKLATEQNMDEYHREIMCWLIYEVERLGKRITDYNKWIEKKKWIDRAIEKRLRG